MLTPEQRQIVDDNIRLAYFAAGLFHKKAKLEHVEHDDILSTCFVGLCKASQTYDPGKSKFSTYAVLAMWRNVERELIPKKRQVDTFSFEELYPDADDANWTEFISDGADIENELVTDLLIECIQSQIANDPKLSPCAKDIIHIHCLNPHLTQREIAKLAGCSQDNVAYTYKSVKARYRQALAI